MDVQSESDTEEDFNKEDSEVEEEKNYLEFLNTKPRMVHNLPNPLPNVLIPFGYK